MSKDSSKVSGAVVGVREVRNAYSPRVRKPLVIEGPSLTKQSFKDECDINVIMKRYASTGVLPGAERAAGARYMDCSVIDYQQSMLLVASAKSMFLDLPAAVRDRFGNDPAKLMEFVEDKRNLEEARALGLARPEAKEGTPLAVRVVEPLSGDPSQSLTRVEAGEGRPGPTANAGGPSPVPK